MSNAFPTIRYKLDKQQWFAQFDNGSQIWFGGIDEKERSEKILGQEHSTIFLNECSQIPIHSRELTMTRLAQLAKQVIPGAKVDGVPLKTRMYYDANPPTKSHWTYKIFIQRVDPHTKKPLDSPEDYESFQINPVDNESNLSAEYLHTLRSMSARLRKRFLDGEFQDGNSNILFSDIDIEKWRVVDTRIPDMVRVVVGVDPSGSGDDAFADNDAIGIVVCGLGTDGNAYVLEDCTVKAGPSTWGKVATNAYERHEANIIVGEGNYGGAMVEHVIRTARPRTPYKMVTATRGKVVRAEPFAALMEQGKIRMVGFHHSLEEELCQFTTGGYMGDDSPNRADACIWALTELFAGIVHERPLPKKTSSILNSSGTSFMAD
jgi:predicted phage terminase large subunit-like protein